jgi:carbamate kinase
MNSFSVFGQCEIWRVFVVKASPGNNPIFHPIHHITDMLNKRLGVADWSGGGGIPVVEDQDGLKGIDAMIDKDKSCSKLAQELKADMLIILTAVDCVCINFNKPDQRELKTLTEQETRDYIAEGQFAKGSMLPKVEVCLDFVKTLPGRIAVITSLKQAEHACEEGVGTKICSDRHRIEVSDEVPGKEVFLDLNQTLERN